VRRATRGAILEGSAVRVPDVAAVLLVLPLALAAPVARAGDVPADTYAPEVLRADLAELYGRLRASHYDLYARRSQAEYDALFARVTKGLRRPLTRTDAMGELQRFVAYGRVAHARIGFPAEALERYRQDGGKLFPLRLRVVDGRVRVAVDASGVAGVEAGTEVLEVDGKRAADWLAFLGRNVSADSPYMLDTLLEDDAPALVWLEFPGRERFRLRVRSPGGRARTVDVPARTQAELDAARAVAPRSLDLWHAGREYRILDGAIGYLRPGAFYERDPKAANPWDPAAFLAFVDQAFTEFVQASAPAVLIDLRDNPGGDSSFSDPMMAWFATRPFRFASRFQIRVSEAAVASNQARASLPGTPEDSPARRLAAAYQGKQPGETVDFEVPTVEPRGGERYRGKVYLLVNRHSYSNTVMVAALAQDLGFATILGEETSDLATTYGAMEQLTLSRTGIVVGFPKALIVRPSGSRAARGVVPDVAIPTPLIEPADDPVLRRALEIVRGRG
jgi:C-terminal processing protease CtpA/Prc